MTKKKNGGTDRLVGQVASRSSALRKPLPLPFRLQFPIQIARPSTRPLSLIPHRCQKETRSRGIPKKRKKKKKTFSPTANSTTLGTYVKGDAYSKARTHVGINPSTERGIREIITLTSPPDENTGDDLVEVCIKSRGNS